MSSWIPEDLTALEAASEITIATERPDGTTRRPLPIWIVRVGDELYVRSYHGPDGSWHRQVARHPYAQFRGRGREVRVRLVPVGAAVTGVDEAYWAKYGSGGYGAAMTTPDAAATTMRVEPAS
ncbi:DUF2255 family protein [Actinotalea ferrariae]|uniref:DUF2255 family protein n=1 Tax=Actinotalea ferrariae TaxID=1386098 RepID=UPI001C8CACE5|nr:DUF2255 family protein [Actinotalea ferrariae]MBX9244335.1 DUF2255 family protein [Actinotalea ferrariae]